MSTIEIYTKGSKNPIIVNNWAEVLDYYPEHTWAQLVELEFWNPITRKAIATKDVWYHLCELADAKKKYESLLNKEL